MSNEIAIRPQNTMPSVVEMNQLLDMCKVLAQAPFYQKLGAGGVMAIYMTAKELGLPVMFALNGGLYNVDGKVTMSAQTMAMMITKAGHQAKVVTLTNEACEIHFIRSDRDEDNATFKYSFTVKDAERAGLMHKDNWKKYPRDMLFARCMSAGAKKHMSDVLMNCYVPEELEDIKQYDSKVISVPAIQQVNNESVQTEPIKISKDYESFGDKLTEKEVLDLAEIIKGCSVEYREKIVNLMRITNVFTIFDLPYHLYDKLLAKAIIERDDYQASLKKEEVTNESCG